MIHHLNCGTMCPQAASQLGLVDRDPGHLVARCLVIEDDTGLILIDTGFGTEDVASPGRLGPARFLIAPRLTPAETAAAQIRALGLDPADVRHVLITHLDLDHAGGLADFPNAEVHLHAVELELARRRPLATRLRYRPGQWEHRPRWVEHAEQGEPWYGFERVRLIDGLSVEIAMVPLFGHTAGHCGYAVRSGDGWLLHAGDAYLHHSEVTSPPRPAPALAAYHALNSDDRRRRRENADRLAALIQQHDETVTVFCSHDPVELRRDAPAPAG